MSDTVVGRAGEQISETARAASRLTSAMGDVVEEGLGVARRVAKQAGDAAEEWFDDTTKRLERHPVETVVGSMGVGVAIGVAIGILIGWLVSRK
jgi:acid phosphatase family membrane protein YuiD